MAQNAVDICEVCSSFFSSSRFLLGFDWFCCFRSFWIDFFTLSFWFCRGWYNIVRFVNAFDSNFLNGTAVPLYNDAKRVYCIYHDEVFSIGPGPYYIPNSVRN